MALLAAGVGPGDEVLCPDLTFIAPANMIAAIGAMPVLVDIEPEGFNIDPALMEAGITPRTKAVIVVHQFGHAADMDPICAISRRHNLVVIEDVAESIGARYKGTLLGTIGDMACYSFFGNKIITTGEGGMIVTKSAEYDAKLRVLRDHGMTSGKNTITRSLGSITALRTSRQPSDWRSSSSWTRSSQFARPYQSIFSRRFANARGLRWRPNLEYSTSVFWLATVTLDREEWREPLMAHLRQAGIEPRPMIFPVHFCTVLWLRP